MFTTKTEKPEGKTFMEAHMSRQNAYKALEARREARREARQAAEREAAMRRHPSWG